MTSAEEVIAVVIVFGIGYWTSKLANRRDVVHRPRKLREFLEVDPDD